MRTDRPTVLDCEEWAEDRRRGRYSDAHARALREMPAGWKLISVRPDSPGGPLITARLPKVPK